MRNFEETFAMNKGIYLLSRLNEYYTNYAKNPISTIIYKMYSFT